jgi:hypothetical protein
MTNKTLSEIESMVYRAKFHNEFLEEKLQASLDPIFTFPGSVPSEFYAEIKHLLFQVSGIDKSANFGYFFYEKMQENPYPFCEDILKTATYTERYYNLHDKALKSYVRSFLINNQVDPRKILEYDKIIPEGHGRHFFEELKKIERFRMKEPMTISAEHFKTLFHVVDNDAFPMTQKKAACIVAYLNIERLLPVFAGKISSMLRLPLLEAEMIIVLMHLIMALQIIKPAAIKSEIIKAVDVVIKSSEDTLLFKNFASFRKNYGPALQLLPEFFNKAPLEAFHQ